MKHTLTVSTAQMHRIAKALAYLTEADGLDVELADAASDTIEYVESAIDATDCYEHFDFTL